MSEAIPSGQWLGQFQGPTPGFALLSVEPDRLHTAVASVVQPNGVPASRIEFELSGTPEKVLGKETATWAFDRTTGLLVTPEDYIAKHPGITFSKGIVVRAAVDGQKATGTWKGDHGEFAFTLENTSSRDSRKADHLLSWNDFKDYVEKIVTSRQRYFYRGHADSRWKLATSFHRHGRYDLLRYRYEDIPKILHQVNAISNRPYDLAVGDDFGSFLSLIQHHGYPTPLLDWTRSVYVAAFFALEFPLAPKPDAKNARVYVFDGNEWGKDTFQTNQITDPQPSLSIKEFSALNNPRHIPQQSVHFFSNMADIEWLVEYFEKRNKKNYLTTIDIPLVERNHALRDLEMMGVTAASLFPGLDGICRANRQHQFLVH